MVTHYQRLLNYIVPDHVHVLLDGRIVKSGGKELAVELESRGYEWLEPPRGGAHLMAPALAAPAVAAPEFGCDGVRGRPSGGRAGLARGRARRRPWRASREIGLPTARDEDWRHDAIAPIARTPLRARARPSRTCPRRPWPASASTARSAAARSCS